MRSLFGTTLAAVVLGMAVLVPQVTDAQAPVSTAVYTATEDGVTVTPVRAYRPYYGRYAYTPYAAYRPYYGYRPYVRPYYRPYAYPYGVYRPTYGYRGYYPPAPYYGGYYTYGRPGFSFGFGW